MASKAGVVLDLLVLVMAHDVWCIAVIMAFGAAVERGFTLLDGRVALSA